MNKTLVDDSVIRSTFGDDDATVVEILQSFLAPAGKTVRCLSAGLEQRMLEEVRIAAHNLGSGALQIGAMELGHLAREVEQATNRGDWEFIENNVPTIEALMQQVASYIENL